MRGIEYECMKCGTKFSGKKKNCPNCGQKQYYCQFSGCDKQLDHSEHRFCSEHAYEMRNVNKKAKPIAIIVALVIFVFAPACVLVWVFSKGKINPFKIALQFIGIKL